MHRDAGGEYVAGGWLRSPRWSQHTPFNIAAGAMIFVQVGHLGAHLLRPEEVACPRPVAADERMLGQHWICAVSALNLR